MEKINTQHVLVPRTGRRMYELQTLFSGELTEEAASTQSLALQPSPPAGQAAPAATMSPRPFPWLPSLQIHAERTPGERPSME